MESIAQINPEKFYQQAFPSTGKASEFFKTALAQKEAKQILYQVARMLWLADQLEPFTKGRHAFQILFYLTAAELCAKIVRNYSGETQSRQHVRIFFEEICTDTHRQKLRDGFSRQDENGIDCQVDIRKVIDILYDVRCDVVHRGEYDFFLQTEKDDGDSIQNLVSKMPMPISVSIKLHELRQIILEGAIEGVKQGISKKTCRGESCPFHS